MTKCHGFGLCIRGSTGGDLCAALGEDFRQADFWPFTVPSSSHYRLTIGSQEKPHGVTTQTARSKHVRGAAQAVTRNTPPPAEREGAGGRALPTARQPQRKNTTPVLRKKPATSALSSRAARRKPWRATPPPPLNGGGTGRGQGRGAQAMCGEVCEACDSGRATEPHTAKRRGRTPPKGHPAAWLAVVIGARDILHNDVIMPIITRKHYVNIDLSPICSARGERGGRRWLPPSETRTLPTMTEKSGL